MTRAVYGVDCGKVINPNLLRLNVEVGIGFALSGALHSSEIHFKDAHAVEGNFDTYGMLKLEEIPEIEVVIIDSGRLPQGSGETAIAVVVLG